MISTAKRAIILPVTFKPVIKTTRLFSFLSEKQFMEKNTCPVSIVSSKAFEQLAR